MQYSCKTIQAEAGKKKVGSYNIDLSKRIGSGQFSSVYEALNIENKRLVAAKIINKKTLPNDESAASAIKRQVQILKSLKSDNIIKLIGYEQTDNNIYIFQELADCNLSHIFKSCNEKKFDETTSVKVIIQLLNGISELIQNGIIHGDLKPENILIKKGKIKLADFGLSSYHNDSKQSKIGGTPTYMAPQLFQQDKGMLNLNKCDIWSFGIICYEMIVGQTPWKIKQNSNFQQAITQIYDQSKKIEIPSNIVISERLKKLIQGCLKVRIQQRLSWKQIYGNQVFDGKLQHLILKVNKNSQNNC